MLAIRKTPQSGYGGDADKKKDKMMRHLLLLAVVVLSCSSLAQQLHIEVTGLRSEKGNLRIAFYNTAESFDNDQPALFNKTVSKSNIKNGVLKVSFSGLAP